MILKKNKIQRHTVNLVVSAYFMVVSFRHYSLINLLLLLGLLLNSMNLSAQHEKVKTYYTNKNLQSKGSTYTYSIYYDVKSMPKKFRTFGQLTKKEKEWKYWYQNGQLARIEHYKLVINKDWNDLRDGIWIYYNEQGIKYREDIYKDGKLETSIREIYCDSVLAGKINIHNGLSDTSLYMPLTKQNNFIINPDFDFFYYKPIPIVYHGQDKIEDWVPFWTTPGNYTPDYISNLRFIDVLDYHSLFDFKMPEKFNYVGVALFKEADDYSEYIQGNLNGPLIKSKKYCLRIYINSTKYSKYLVNRLACYLSPAPVLIDSQNEDSFSPQVIFSFLPTESKEFVTLCGYFNARGGEKVLSIGRFNKTENLSVTARDNFPISQFSLEKSAYYLIDKIELFEIHDSIDCNCRIGINGIRPNQKLIDTANLSIKSNLNKLSQGESVVLKNVNFDFNSFILLKSSEATLNTFLEFLNENPTLRVSIEGHTDDIGTEEYNLELSTKRAKSVCNWLVNRGIQQQRLEYKGYGKKQPLINSTEDKNRAINRRVEVKVINN
jgi:OmpA-OmpF porin, OOP family